jgi:hypothetical protein
MIDPNQPVDSQVGLTTDTRAGDTPALPDAPVLPEKTPTYLNTSTPGIDYNVNQWQAGDYNYGSAFEGYDINQINQLVEAGQAAYNDTLANYRNMQTTAADSASRQEQRMRQLLADQSTGFADTALRSVLQSQAALDAQAQRRENENAISQLMENARLQASQINVDALNMSGLLEARRLEAEEAARQWEEQYKYSIYSDEEMRRLDAWRSYEDMMSRQSTDQARLDLENLLSQRSSEIDWYKQELNRLIEQYKLDSTNYLVGQGVDTAGGSSSGSGGTSDTGGTTGGASGGPGGGPDNAATVSAGRGNMPGGNGGGVSFVPEYTPENQPGQAEGKNYDTMNWVNRLSRLGQAGNPDRLLNQIKSGSLWGEFSQLPEDIQQQVLNQASKRARAAKGRRTGRR